MNELAYQPSEEMGQLLYSEVKLPAAAMAASNTTYDAFSKGQTDTGQGFSAALTVVQTNLKTGAKLERPFVARSLGAEIIPNDITAASNVLDAHLLRNKVAVVFKIGNEQIPLGPLGTLPADYGMSVDAITAASGGNATQVVSAQNGRRTPRRELRPTIIPAGTPFSLGLVCDPNDLPTLTAIQRIRFYIDGQWID